MKNKKLLSKITAGLIALFMLSGCTAPVQSGSSESEKSSSSAMAESSSAEENSGTAESSGAEKTKNLFANADKTLSIYIGFNANISPYMSSLEEHTVVKKMTEITGINFKFMHPPEGDDGTYMNTLIASGEYPDIFSNDFSKYPGGVDGAIDDGILIDINPLVEKYGTNFNALMATKPDYVMKNLKSDSGKIVHFGSPMDPPLIEGKQHTGPIIRQDWLDELGLKSPTTIDELTAVLKAFKGKGVRSPLALYPFSEYTEANNNFISGAFGVSLNGFQLSDDGKMVYSRTMPGYKEFLTYMNSLMADELIDRDFINRTGSDATKLLYSDEAGIVCVGNWATREVMEVGKKSSPNFNISGMQLPRKTDGNAEYTLANPRQQGADGGGFQISTACKEPELAMQFLDWLYTPEAIELSNYGVGDLGDGNSTFNLVDGKYEFTDFIMKNPDVPFNTFREVYTIQGFQTVFHEDYQRQQYCDPINDDCWAKWTANVNNKNSRPVVLTISTDESKEYANIMNAVNTYTDEMVYKFILGDKPLTEWDSFVKEVEGANLTRATEIEQAAYERYLAR